MKFQLNGKWVELKGEGNSHTTHVALQSLLEKRKGWLGDYSHRLRCITITTQERETNLG